MRRTVTLLAAFAAAVALWPGSATGAGGRVDFFICPDGPACRALGPQGLALDLTGQGTVDLSTRRATGTGRFVLWQNGKVIERGTWVADRMVSYFTYGAATPEQVRAVKAEEGFTLPPGSEGGKMSLRVHDPADGTRAIFKINCLLGTRVHGEEGVKTTVFGFSNFTRPAGHPETLFVRH
jgi:hypothetical protein